MWYEPVIRKLHEGSQSEITGEIFNLEGKYGNITLQVTGISGTEEIKFEVSIDGTNWVSVRGRNLTDGDCLTSTAADGVFFFPVVGVKFFRAPIETRDSGTIYVTAIAVPADSPPDTAEIAIEGTVDVDADVTFPDKQTVDISQLGDDNKVDVTDKEARKLGEIKKIDETVTVDGAVEIDTALPAGTIEIGSVTDSRDLRGLIGDRPAASAANRGYTYWAIDRLDQADEFSVSNGTAWEDI